MQKWEYGIVTCGQTTDGIWRPRLVNGAELPNWERNQPVPAYLNQLGDEGWELVHVHIDTIGVPGAFGQYSMHTKETAFRFFMKRPKP